MNLQRRSMRIVVMLLVITAALMACNQFLFIPDFGLQRPTSWQLTATSIVATNNIVQTLIYQTEAAAQAQSGTLTPTPTS